MKKTTKKFCSRISTLFCVFFLIISVKISAQVSAYTFAQTAGAYSRVVPGVSLTTSGLYDDNNFTTVTLPFTFTYHGTAFTNIGISANGYVVLGAGTITSYTPLSTQANCISAFGADLEGNVGN